MLFCLTYGELKCHSIFIRNEQSVSNIAHGKRGGGGYERGGGLQGHGGGLLAMSMGRLNE